MQRVRSFTNPQLHNRPSAFFAPFTVDFVTVAQNAIETQKTTLAQIRNKGRLTVPCSEMPASSPSSSRTWSSSFAPSSAPAPASPSVSPVADGFSAQRLAPSPGLAEPEFAARLAFSIPATLDLICSCSSAIFFSRASASVALDSSCLFLDSNSFNCDESFSFALSSSCTREVSTFGSAFFANASSSSSSSLCSLKLFLASLSCSSVWASAAFLASNSACSSPIASACFLSASLTFSAPEFSSSSLIAAAFFLCSAARSSRVCACSSLNFSISASL